MDESRKKAIGSLIFSLGLIALLIGAMTNAYSAGGGCAHNACHLVHWWCNCQDYFWRQRRITQTTRKAITIKLSANR
jgi:hypothetical protein